MAILSSSDRALGSWRRRSRGTLRRNSSTALAISSTSLARTVWLCEAHDWRAADAAELEVVATWESSIRVGEEQDTDPGRTAMMVEHEADGNIDAGLLVGAQLRRAHNGWGEREWSQPICAVKEDVQCTLSHCFRAVAKGIDLHA